MKRDTIHGAILVLAAAVLTACSLPNETATQAAAAVSGDLSDGEILRVMEVLNTGEIGQAELAMEKSSNGEVQDTAEMIVREHSSNNERIQSISQSANLQLEESPLSRGLSLQANQITDELQELSGQAFECTYLEKQIELHALALETVQNDLVPDAESQEVRDLLASTAPALEEHLESARNAQQSMEQCA